MAIPRSRWYLGLLLCVAVLSMEGCKSSAQNAIVAPKLDFSTPKSAVSSYMMQTAYASEVSKRALDMKTFFVDLKVKDTKGAWAEEDIVIDVNKETDKSAIVEVSWLYTNDSKSREVRSVYLEKSGNEWKIAEIRMRCLVCKGSGKTDDLSSGTYPWPKVFCQTCGGKGWLAIYYLPALKY